MLGGQAKLTFTDYCERMGLLTEEEKKQNAALKQIQKLQNKQTAKEAAKRADEIMRIDKMNREKEREAKGG